MIGDRIRVLRETRSWTQAHLADASGVSLRTIQRLERLHSCSAETLLALAATLEVNVRELTEPAAIQTGPVKKPLWGNLAPPRAAAWGLLLASPIFLFVAVNLLKSGIGLGAPYDQLASIGSRLALVQPFEILSPFLFVGGALAAIALTFASQVSPIVTGNGRDLSFTGLRVRVHAGGAAVLLLALAALASLAAYLMVENFGELVRSMR